MENEEQELIFRLSMYEQQINHLQQQIQAIEQAVIEISSLNIGINELVGSEGKEILAPIGRGIFVKAKLISEEFLVDIGERNFVKKSIPETQKIIEKQIEKLEDVKEELNINLGRISEEIHRTINNAPKKEKKTK